MELRGSLLRRFLSGKTIDAIRDLLFRLRLGGSLGLADARTAQAAIGEVDPDWRRRIDDVLSCPDNAHIPRVPEAGQTRDGLVTLHNGIRVSAMGYYGSGVLNMLIENRGVHEPQEERAFAEILNLLSAGGTMMELGSYWGFYSLWFAHRVADARCFLVEPNAANLLSGKINFRRAGKRAVFERAYVGREEGRAEDGTRIVNVDAFCRRKGIAHLSILHSDIQGAEAEMLRGATAMVGGQKVDYLFISTHDNALHYECAKLLTGYGYVVLASADCDETYSDDGVLVARSPRMELPRELPISVKPKPPRPQSA
jgi:hypothetical protein